MQSAVCEVDREEDFNPNPVIPIYVCPACGRAWVDESRKFAACHFCPFRIPPEAKPVHDGSHSGGRS